MARRTAGEDMEIDLLRHIKELYEEQNLINENMIDLQKNISLLFSLIMKVSFENRLMIIGSALPPAFQTNETKSKMAQATKLYIEFSTQLDKWVDILYEISKSKDSIKQEKLIAEANIIYNKIIQQMRDFVNLTSKLWEEYLKWNKEIGRDGFGKK